MGQLIVHGSPPATRAGRRACLQPGLSQPERYLFGGRLAPVSGLLPHDRRGERPDRRGAGLQAARKVPRRERDVPTVEDWRPLVAEDGPVTRPLPEPAFTRHGSKAGHSSGVADVDARRRRPRSDADAPGARWLSPAGPPAIPLLLLTKIRVLNPA